MRLRIRRVFRLLAELGHVPGDYHIEAVLRPALLIEPAHSGARVADG